MTTGNGLVMKIDGKDQSVGYYESPNPNRMVFSLAVPMPADFKRINAVGIVPFIESKGALFSGDVLKMDDWQEYGFVDKKLTRLVHYGDHQRPESNLLASFGSNTVRVKIIAQNGFKVGKEEIRGYVQDVLDELARYAKNPENYD